MYKKVILYSGHTPFPMGGGWKYAEIVYNTETKATCTAILSPDNDIYAFFDKATITVRGKRTRVACFELASPHPQKLPEEQIRRPHIRTPPCTTHYLVAGRVRKWIAPITLFEKNRVPDLGRFALDAWAMTVLTEAVRERETKLSTSEYALLTASNVYTMAPDSGAFVCALADAIPHDDQGEDPFYFPVEYVVGEAKSEDPIEQRMALDFVVATVLWARTRAAKRKQKQKSKRRRTHQDHGP